MGTVRRLFLRRVVEGIVGLVGVALGLKWIETGVVDNSGATAAARTFNQAVERQREGRTALRRAREAAEREAWIRSEDLYHDAYIAYYEAATRYRAARDTAREADCEALATIAERYRTYCRHMEDACTAWANAAEHRQSGDTAEATSSQERGDRLREKALAAVDERTPAKRDVSDPRC